MIKVRSGHFPVVLTPKTCARCGRDFGAVDREYTCPTCKKPAPKDRSGPQELSSRERQIVELVRQAKSNKEIAYDLCLTTGTVKEYLYHIFRKLGVSNRTALALWTPPNRTVAMDDARGGLPGRLVAAQHPVPRARVS